MSSRPPSTSAASPIPDELADLAPSREEWAAALSLAELVLAEFDRRAAAEATEEPKPCKRSSTAESPARSKRRA